MPVHSTTKPFTLFEEDTFQTWLNGTPFLVRMDPAIIKALKQWAADELRSVNGQVEYVIRDALRKEGRLPKPKSSEDTSS